MTSKLFGVLVVFSLVLVAHGQGRKPNAASEAISDVKPDQTKLRANPLVVTGLSSVLEYPKMINLAFGDSEPICVDFFVRNFSGTARKLRLTTSGIAGARLLDLTARNPVSSCGESPKLADTAIALSLPGDAERSIRMFIPAIAFPDASAGAKGKLIMIRDDDPPSELSVTLMREAYGPFVKAFLWFWGVFIPAVLVSVLGAVGYWFQKNIDAKSVENEVLERFKRSEADNLRGFFEGLYQNRRIIRASNEYRESVERDLEDRGILAALPRKTREQILKALRLGERDKVDEQLAEAFPENAEAILKPSAMGRSE